MNDPSEWGLAKELSQRTEGELGSSGRCCLSNATLCSLARYRRPCISPLRVTRRSPLLLDVE